LSRKVQLCCAWSGPALIVLIFAGLIPAAHLIPPPSPSWSAEHVARFYVHHRAGIRVGMVLTMMGGAFIVPWAVGLSFQLSRTTDAHPALSSLQVASAAIAMVLLMSFALIGSVAAFRPDTLAPGTTRLLDDILWFWWLIPWPPFSLWSVVVGILILRDRTEPPLFPRWAGYFSILAAMSYVPGSLCLFFKHGAFGFAGAVVWYEPTIVFFSWMVVMTALMLGAAERDETVASTVPPAPARGRDTAVAV
jgi:Domain of unknown function (DUF4386)